MGRRWSARVEAGAAGRQIVLSTDSPAGYLCRACGLSSQTSQGGGRERTACWQSERARHHVWTASSCWLVWSTSCSSALASSADMSCCTCQHARRAVASTRHAACCWRAHALPRRLISMWHVWTGGLALAVPAACACSCAQGVHLPNRAAKIVERLG